MSMSVDPTSVLLREPNLLVPNMSPIGNVKLNKNHNIKGYYVPFNGGEISKIYDYAEENFLEDIQIGTTNSTLIKDRYGSKFKTAPGTGDGEAFITPSKYIPPKNITIFCLFRGLNWGTDTVQYSGGFCTSETTVPRGGDASVLLYCGIDHWGYKPFVVTLTYSDSTILDRERFSTSVSNNNDPWSIAFSVSDASELRMAAVNLSTRQTLTHTKALTKSLNQQLQVYNVFSVKPYSDSNNWIRSGSACYYYLQGWMDIDSSMTKLLDICNDPYQFLEPI